MEGCYFTTSQTDCLNTCQNNTHSRGKKYNLLEEFMYIGRCLALTIQVLVEKKNRIHLEIDDNGDVKRKQKKDTAKP